MFGGRDTLLGADKMFNKSMPLFVTFTLIVWFCPSLVLAKQRSWFGPRSFVPNPPSARAGARIAFLHDAFFMFGGIEAAGASK